MVYRPGAVDFNGMNALMIVALAATDNDFYSFATWQKMQRANWINGTTTLFVTDSEGNFTNFVVPYGGASFEFSIEDTAGANQLNFGGSLDALLDNAWTFLIGSGNSSTGAGQMQTQAGAITGAPIRNNTPFALANNGKSFWFMGDSFGAADYVTGCASDTSFWPGVSFLNMAGAIDPTILSYFIDGMGNPVDPAVAIANLGTPAVLFSGPAATYATNLGSGGGFTLIGPALTNCSDAPGPPPVVPYFNYGGSSRVNVRNIKSSAFERMSVQARGMELANLTRL